MMLLDANVLVCAFRTEMPDHAATKAWLEQTIADRRGFGVVDAILCSFIRIVTRKPFDPITPVDKAFDFVGIIRSAPSCRIIAPNAGQWDLFEELCRRTRSHGKAAEDAYWASFAIDLESEWLTFDAGFARVPGLQWRSPLEARTVVNPV